MTDCWFGGDHTIEDHDVGRELERRPGEITSKSNLTDDYCMTCGGDHPTETHEYGRIIRFPAPADIDPRKLSTDCAELDRRLVRWLDLHCGGRDMRREGDRCVLVDRGQEISIPGQAVDEASAYEDSFRKSLQVAIDQDYFEAKTGRKPGPGE